MDVDGDLFQQAGLFERLAAAQDGVADDRVVFPVIPRRQRVQDGLLLEEPQRAKTSVGEEGVVGNTELQPQAGNGRLLVPWRQRIAQPFPGVAFVRRHLRRLSPPAGPCASPPSG